VVDSGPGLKPGASLYTRKRLCLSLFKCDGRRGKLFFYLTLVVGAHIAYSALFSMYTRLDKTAVATGPATAVDRFNAQVSRHALAELDGRGVTAVAATEAASALAAWQERQARLNSARHVIIFFRL